MDAPVVERAELFVVRLPLRTPMITAHGTTGERVVTLVRLHAGGLAGWGECSALDRPGYSAEWASGAYGLLRDVLVPLVLGEPVDPARLGRRLDTVTGNPMARAAVATAAADAALRHEGVPLALSLGATARRVRAGATVSVTDDLDRLEAAVADLVGAGYRHLKIKIRPGWELEPARVALAAGGRATIGVDANGSFRTDHLTQLARLDGLGLAYVEQPLPADDLVGGADVAARLDTPVILDESVTSPAAVSTIAALRAGDGIRLKAPMVGGPHQARAAHDVARRSGLSIAPGGTLETGVGRAAALAVAALGGCDLPADVPASDRWLVQDVVPPSALDADGTLAVPSAPGLGVDVDLATVHAHCLHHDDLGD